MSWVKTKCVQDQMVRGKKRNKTTKGVGVRGGEKKRRER
jgi:hypothetical protein